MSIQTYIGNLSLQSCIYNASGPRCTTIDELKAIDNSDSAVVLSKSSTLLPRDGNPQPRYYHNSLGSINSMGLPNKGYEYYINASQIIHKPYMISVNGLTLNDTIKIIQEILKVDTVQGIEINLSCPNIIGKGQLAYDLDEMDKYLNSIFSLPLDFHKLVIGVKLPPYFDLHWYPQVTNIIKKYPISFVTCINSIGNGLLINPNTEEVLIKPKGGMGGIGGSYVKPVGLSNVRNFYLEFKKQNLNIDVIGCGGVEKGIDVFEYILCGAKAVQIGTEFYRQGCRCFTNLEKELKDYMDIKRYDKLSDFYGKLKVLE